MVQEILVAGATGRTGKIIVEKLIHQGFKPHVLVRDLPTAHEQWGETVIYHQGDVRDINSLMPALRGVQGLISAIGARCPVGKNCPKRVGYQGVKNLVQAAGAVGVSRFILISSIAVTRQEHPLNHFGKVLTWKFKGEQVLRQCGLDYVIIRPGGLKDTPGGRRALIFAQGDRLLGMISRSDLAEICLHALQYPHPLRVTFEVIESDRKDKIHWHRQFTSLTKD